MPVLRQPREAAPDHVALPTSAPDWREQTVAKMFELSRYFIVSAPAWSMGISHAGFDAVTATRFYGIAHENLRTIIDDLALLRTQPERDQHGLVRPADYAFWRTVEIVAEAYAKMRDRFPPPFLSTDTSGAIRLTWIRRGREVRAFLPSVPNERRYLYHEQDDDFGSVPDFDSDALVQWLEWTKGE